MLTCAFTAGLGARVQHRLAGSEKVQRRHRRPVRETPGRGHGRPRDQRCLHGRPRGTGQVNSPHPPNICRTYVRHIYFICRAYAGRCDISLSYVVHMPAR